MNDVIEISTDNAKEITLRKFEFGDLPKLSKILKKLEIKDIVKKFFAAPDVNQDKSKMQEEFGAELVASAITNLWMAETEIYEFVAGLCGQTIEEVKKFDIDTLLDLFSKFAQNAGSVVSFFKLAAK